MKTTVLSAIVAAIILSTTTASAQQILPNNDIPRTISYQGQLTNSDGSPLIDGSYQITISLCANPDGSNPVWQETYNTSLTRGIFNLYLGSPKNPLPDATILNQPLWVATRIGDGMPMSPLTPLSASPYALNVSDKSITNGKLADGAVTAEKVDMDYVSSITVNGQPVTAKGTVLNIEGSDDIALSYNDATNTLRLSKPSPTTQGDNEKGSTVLGTTSDFWTMRGNGRTDNGGTVTPVSGDFIGTTNNLTFEVRTNNVQVMRYQPSGTTTPNIVGGFSGNSITTPSIGSIIAGGGVTFSPNVINNDANFATIGGGFENAISADEAVIGGGSINTVNGTSSVISGGTTNLINSNLSVIGGGSSNAVNDLNGVIAGGDNNTVDGQFSAISGGAWNIVRGNRSTIAGGGAAIIPNTIDADYSFIGTGNDNTINAGATASVIGGGTENLIDGVEHGVIGGGMLNNIQAEFSFIGGGADNNITGLSLGTHNVIVGGESNVLSGDHSATVGGSSNTVYGDESFVGGGRYNQILTDHSVIAGGLSNNVQQNFGTIGGGESNLIGAAHSTIPGGHRLITTAYAQTAVGFFNAPRGTLASNPTILIRDRIDDPLFMVGNGQAPGPGPFPIPSNAFEVSYNGHSVVFDVNGPTTGGRTPFRGATYTDNIIYAWGDIAATGAINSDFGIAAVANPAPGVFTVTIRMNNPTTGAPITLTSASIVATLVNEGPTAQCGSIHVTRIGTPLANQFQVFTNGASCEPVNLPFMFHLTGR